MEIKLVFTITFVNGEVTTQEISVPADPKLPVEKQMMFLLQQGLVQYAQVGLLRNPDKSSKFVLVCPSQIAMVECDLPNILLAGANELPKSPAIIE